MKDSEGGQETILIFLKIGTLKHITDMYENGTIYMNSLDFFKEIEDDFLRGDENEGAIHKVNTANATIKFPWMDSDIHPSRIQYGTYLESGNLFSLYSISSKWDPNPLGFRFDARNLDFGSHCVVIKQPGVFIKKVESELIKKGYLFKHGFVKYYEEQERLMDLTPFHKPNAFKYQKEFRFFVENEVKEPIKINIGSMKAYAEIVAAKGFIGLELKQEKSSNEEY